MVARGRAAARDGRAMAGLRYLLAERENVEGAQPYSDGAALAETHAKSQAQARRAVERWPREEPRVAAADCKHVRRVRRGDGCC